jgi:hypothetical protein
MRRSFRNKKTWQGGLIRRAQTAGAWQAAGEEEGKESAGSCSAQRKSQTIKRTGIMAFDVLCILVGG